MFSRSNFKQVKTGKVTVTIPVAISPTLAKFNISNKVVEQLGFSLDDPNILINVMENDEATGVNGRFAITRGSQCKVSPSLDNDKKPTGTFTFSQSRAWGVIIQYSKKTAEELDTVKLDEISASQLRLDGFVFNNSGTAKGFAEVEVVKDENGVDIVTDVDGNLLSPEEAEIADEKYPVLALTGWKFEAYAKKAAGKAKEKAGEATGATDEAAADELAPIAETEEEI